MGILLKLLLATTQPGSLDGPAPENFENWGIVNGAPVCIDYPDSDNDEKEETQNERY